jgi:opacity protein-like surface antigen
VKNERADVANPGGYNRSDRFKYGWEAGGALGYDFGKFRLEAEGFHYEATMKSSQRASGIYTADAGNLAGSSNATAFMGNVLFGLGHWGGVKAYAGGGVGWASIALHENTPASPRSMRATTAMPGRLWQA